MYENFLNGNTVVPQICVIVEISCWKRYWKSYHIAVTKGKAEEIE